MAQVDTGALAERTVMRGTIHQVLHCILSHLSGTEVCRLSRVCREWQTVAEKNHLWKKICHNEAVDLQQLTQQGPCYKSIYKEYVVPMKKWTTGQGVTTFSKTLQTPNGEDFSGQCLLISDQYVFAKGPVAANHNITVFCASTGQYSHQLIGLPARPDYVRLSEDGIWAAAYSYDSSVVCGWNVQSGECVHTLQHHAQILTMQLQHGVLAVGLVASPSVYLWSVVSGQLLHQLQGVNRASVLAMDNQHIAVHNRSGSVVQLWDVNTGRHLFTWRGTDLEVMLLDAGTNSLVGIDDDDERWNVRVTVWDTNTGMRRAMIHANPEKSFLGQLIHEGKLLIAYSNLANGMRSIEVVDLRNCAEVLTSVNVGPSGYGARLRMRVLSNGLLIVTSASSDSIHLWDVRKRRFIRRINVGEGPGWIERVHASFNQLQIVLQHDQKLTYVKCDFGA